MPKLIIGLGTGRCGTWSLTKFLQNQDDFSATHEAFFLPWYRDCAKAYSSIIQIYQNEAEYLCDVGFYWINYVDEIVALVPDAKLICLKRDKTKTVESFDGRTPYNNYWTDVSCAYWDWKLWEISGLNAMFPSYNLPKKEAIGKYWEEYYVKAEAYEKLYPKNFKIFSIENLNSENGQDLILEFIGIQKHRRKLGIVKKENVGKNVVINVQSFVKYDRKEEEAGLCGECGKKAPVKAVQNRTYNMTMHVCEDCVKTAEMKLRNYLARYKNG